MLKLGRIKKLALFIQILDDLRIRFLHKKARIGSFGCHITFAVHELYERQIVLAAHLCIVLTEGRSDVYDTGTIRHCDITVTSYIVGFLFLFLRLSPGTGKERFVSLVLQIGTHVGLQNLIGGLSFLRQLPEHIIQKRLRHIIGIAVRRLHFHIGFHGIDTERHIGGQCPGRGRPCQEISILVHHLKPYNCGTLLHRLIALRHLVGRQGGTTARTVWHNLKALIQKTLIPDLLERPPLGLDKIIVICHIGIIHIRPEAYRAGEILPHAFIFPDRFLTLTDKRIQTILLDLLLAIQTQKLLHLQLHR